VCRQDAGVTLKLVDEITGGVEEVDGDGGGEDGPFEPCPTEA